RLMPVLPVLSEESALSAFDERRQWTHYWLVDPLDGTKEFISRNGEFTVNIALIKHGQPVLGVVYVPVTGVTYAGVSDGSIQFAWCRTNTQVQRPLCARALPAPEQWPHSVLRVVASRRHGSDRLEDLLTGWRKKFADVQLVNIGSSLKICLIADGKADIYPRFAPTSEWDTAAAHAVLRAAGGEVVDDTLKPLVYNRKESILNPDFIALAQLSEPIKELLCAKPSPN
ncbi:MAG: 3'(2'),5'-bisphosphate nucleotidase CysQ, partial [Gammaproteobacteria bacterium]|nr:3'(2'),5'-bisphosphate nucleotidase CysQ [Gammaproteobacteria bacterium]